MFGMSDLQMKSFMETVSATAIANQAMWRCRYRGLPLTEDNVISCVGHFFDPTDSEFDGIIEKINAAIEYVVADADQEISYIEGNDCNVIQFRF